MKDANRGHRAWNLGLVAVLLPLTLGSAAQTPLRWNDTAAPATTHPQPPRTVADPLAGHRRAHDASGAVASTCANSKRWPRPWSPASACPGLAMAIVQNGRVLSARGYGITDSRPPQPVDAHTVFRLASLSKAFAGTMTGLLVSTKARCAGTASSPTTCPTSSCAITYASQQLTVADLLSHRVGLTHNTYDRDLERYDDYRVLTQQPRQRAADLPARRLLRLPEHRLQPDRRHRVRGDRQLLQPGGANAACSSRWA